MIPKQVENRLRGSIIVASKFAKEDNKIKAHIHSYKFFKKAIHTDIDIIIDKENHMKYWYTSLNIENEIYSITGSPISKVFGGVGEYITRVCESLLELRS